MSCLFGRTYVYHVPNIFIKSCWKTTNWGSFVRALSHEAWSWPIASPFSSKVSCTVCQVLQETCCWWSRKNPTIFWFHANAVYHMLPIFAVQGETCWKPSVRFIVRRNMELILPSFAALKLCNEHCPSKPARTLHSNIILFLRDDPIHNKYWLENMAEALQNWRKSSVKKTLVSIAVSIWKFVEPVFQG